ncbi:hypothetical protein KUCAC02_037279, partial [Chaenocephalus aceratus]
RSTERRWICGASESLSTTRRAAASPSDRSRAAAQTRRSCIKSSRRNLPETISGHQKSENGKIEWNTEMPVSCSLSKGLQSLLTPVLANILEADQEKCWGFDHLQQATLHHIYIHQYNTAALFQELLSRRCSIPLHHQELHYEGRRLVLDPNRQAQVFPKTSRENPIMLLSREAVATVGLIFEDPSPPKVQPRYDLDLDASYAKTFAGDVGHLWKTSESLLLYQELVRKGVRGLIELMKEDYSEILHKKSEVFHLCSYCTQILQRTEQLFEVMMQANMLSSEYDEICDMHKKVLRISGSLEPIERTSQDLKSKFLPSGLLSDSWILQVGTHPEDRNVEKIKCCWTPSPPSTTSSRRTKPSGVCRTTRSRSTNLTTRSLFTEECAMKYRLFISKSEEWMRYGQELMNIEKEITLLMERALKLQEHVPQKLLPLLSSGMKPQAFLSQNTLVEMTLGMKKLKEEMEGVVKELNENNHFLE